MSIADSIRAEMGERRSPCRTCIFIASRPPGEAREWVDALADRSLTSSAAARVITKTLEDEDPDGPRALPFRSIGYKAVHEHRKAGHK